MSIVNVDSSTYNYELMTSAYFHHDNVTNEKTIVALFNNQAYHTPSISVKSVDEAYIRAMYNLTDFELKIGNRPFPLTVKEHLSNSPSTYQSNYQVEQCIMMASSFLLSSFAVMLVKERVTKGKHLQKVCGVKMYTYWLSYFLIDYVIYLVSMTVVLITFVLYKEKGLYEDQQSLYLLLAIIIIGFALLPNAYFISFAFDAPATAYARLFLYFNVLGIASILADQITGMPQLDMKNANSIMKPIFALFVPIFNLGKITDCLMTNHANNKICNSDTFGFNVQDLCKLPSPPEQVLPCCKGLMIFK